MRDTPNDAASVGATSDDALSNDATSNDATSNDALASDAAGGTKKQTDARKKRGSVRAREKPSGKSKENKTKAAKPKIKKGKQDTQGLEILSALNIAQRLPEIADSMAQAAVEGSTTAARVCLDILDRQPKSGESSVVYVLTHVESGENGGETD